MWAALVRRAPPIALRRERLALPDGDFLDLDWTRRAHGPLVLVLHGLEGSARSRYVRALLHALDARGVRGCAMHFRGCSGEPNRLARSYHSGETDDLDFVVRTLRARAPDAALGIAGYSLGGNVLLKWLGERGARAGVVAAAAVSVPFVLSRSADRLDRGFSKLYQWKLLRDLRASVRRKFRSLPAPIALDGLARLRSFWTFDEHVTAPLHGFGGADDYYARSSCKPYLRQIRVPTLIVHAKDDPFVPADSIPAHSELAECIELDLCEHGGHVGFVEGPTPWQAHYWLETRLGEFFGMRMHRHALAPRPA